MTSKKLAKLEKYLDDLELERLEDDRRVLDMEGWGGDRAQGRWNPARKDG